jgi:rSAM/selenodomain-associated transferase 2
VPRPWFFNKDNKQGSHAVSAVIQVKESDFPAPLRKPDISIILPVLNEADLLPDVLSRLPQSPDLEIILVDGGSTDATRAEACRFPHVRWLSAHRGRGAQMNAGARLAQGDLLVFLHIDTWLTPAHLAALRSAALNPGIKAGAFYLRLTPSTPFLKFISWGANWRSCLFHLPYGDQVIFVRRALFFALGGFVHERPEDLDLVFRLRRLTRFCLLTPPVTSSGRRWVQHGNLKTTGYHLLCLVRYLAERLFIRRWPARGDLGVGEGAKGDDSPHSFARQPPQEEPPPEVQP